MINRLKKNTQVNSSSSITSNSTEIEFHYQQGKIHPITSGNYQNRLRKNMVKTPLDWLIQINCSEIGVSQHLNNQNKNSAPKSALNLSDLRPCRKKQVMR